MRHPIAASALALFLCLAGCDAGVDPEPTAPDGPLGKADDASCEGAYLDDSGYCRLENGQFTFAACCQEPASSCAAVTDDGDALAKTADTTAFRLNRLLELATSSDFGPYAQIHTFDSACTDISGDDAEDLIAAVETAMLDEWAIPADLELASGADGSAAFVAEVGSVVESVEERVSDGLWEPTDTVEGDLLWQQRASLEQVFTGRAGGDQAYVEVRLRTDVAECSEKATALFEPASGRVTVVHVLPRC